MVQVDSRFEHGIPPLSFAMKRIKWKYHQRYFPNYFPLIGLHSWDYIASLSH